MNFFKFLFKILNRTRLVLLNLFFWVILLSIIIALFNSDSSSGDDRDTIKDPNTLSISLSGSLTWINDPMEILLEDKEWSPSLNQLYQILDQAAHDQSITTLVLYVNPTFRASLAHLTDLGEWLNNFKETGKKIEVYAKTLSQSGYLLATYGDKIFLDKEGVVFLPGVSVHSLFYGDFLERYGIKPEVIHKGIYKSAVEPYMNTQFSSAAEENTQGLLNDLWEQYLQVITDNRDLEVSQLVDYTQNYTALLTSKKIKEADLAKEYKLVDSLVDIDSIMNEHRYENASNYLMTILPPDSASQLAVITVQGALMKKDNLWGGYNIESDTLYWLSKALEDPSILGILVVVDSPGGSVDMAEKLRRAFERGIEKGKPMAIYFSSMAASGGFWLATPFDQLYSSAASITGSIGVYSVLPKVNKLLDNTGIYTQTLATTPYSRLYDVTKPLSPTERQLLEYRVDNIYEQFKEYVADNRNIDISMVEPLAQGRVYTGNQALEVNLVDQVTTFNGALGLLAKEVIETVGDVSPFQIYFYSPETSWVFPLVDWINATSLVSAYSDWTEFNSFQDKLENIYFKRSKEMTIEAKSPIKVEW